VFCGRLTNKNTGEVRAVAVKRINTDATDVEQTAKNEAKMLSKFTCGCPNIVRLFGAYRHDKTYTLYLELCDTDLLKWFRQKRQAVSEWELRSIAKQTAEGVHVIHQHNIVHRDIKTSNLLLKLIHGEKFPYIIKITDFGLAVDEVNMDSVVCGTPRYMAPEILLKSKQSDRRVDLYSFGTVLYELRTKAPPVRASSISELQRRFSMPNSPTDGLFYPINTSHSFRNLCNRLLKIDPAERPTITEVLLHPFLVEDDLSDTFVIIHHATETEQTSIDQQRKKRIVNETIRVACALRCCVVFVDEVAVQKYIYELIYNTTQKTLDTIEGTTNERVQLLQKINESAKLRCKGETNNIECVKIIQQSLLFRLESMARIASDNKQYKVSDTITTLITEIEKVLPMNLECSKLVSGAPITSIMEEEYCGTTAVSKPITIPKKSRVQHRFCYSCGNRFSGRTLICPCGEIRGYSY
jgi:serine/threonine protein kinase